MIVSSPFILAYLAKSCQMIKFNHISQDFKDVNTSLRLKYLTLEEVKIMEFIVIYDKPTPPT